MCGLVVFALLSFLSPAIYSDSDPPQNDINLTQPFIEPHGGSIHMSRVTMPVLVRLLMCAALAGVLSASTEPSQDGASSAATRSEERRVGKECSSGGAADE